jgi:hypothetical protein
VTMRIAAVAALALSCAACANQETIQPMGLGFHGQIDIRNASAPTAAKAKAGKTARKKTLNPHIKQTLGGKVLSAIALERVTGRKPDPSRFNELR